MEKKTLGRISNSYLVEELKLFSKYLYPILGIGFFATMLIIYVSYYMKLERDIVNITYQNSLKKNRILELEREIAVLSSPHRIKKIAEKDLKMIPVSYDKVKFIEKGNK
jgi:cell division protein FtsL